jgi:Spy/CpxP family protein refolding chaperone
MMKNRLSLTDEQTEKVKEILLNERKTMMEEREKNAGDREAMMKARREALDRTDKEIEAILTPEQKEKYQVLKKEIREQRQSRMRRGR